MEYATAVYALQAAVSIDTDWESHYNSKEVPKYRDLIPFLKGYCSELQSIIPTKPVQVEPRKNTRLSVIQTGVQSTNCFPFCGEAAHSAFKGSRVSKMKISERVDAVKKHSLCLNCLSSGHIARTCTRGSCFHCGQRHHSYFTRTRRPTRVHNSRLGNQMEVNHPRNLQDNQCNHHKLSQHKLVNQHTLSTLIRKRQVQMQVPLNHLFPPLTAPVQATTPLHSQQHDTCHTQYCFPPQS